MTNYRKDIGADEIVRALMSDPSLDFKKRDSRLYKGRCPSCGEKELWTTTAKPWVLFCNRSTNCGWSAPVRELLPDLFADFAKRYPPTDKDRNATASAYLGIDRGFDLSKIRGWYEQGTFQRPGYNSFTPTVRFYLDREKGIWMERFIDSQFIKGIKRKAHFQGKYKGLAWTPPGLTLEKGDQCFLVEGCIHTIALAHMEDPKKAAACLSSKTFPTLFIDKHKGQNITWVIALDGDKSGREGIKIFVKKLKALGEKYKVLLLPDNGMDWDDYHRNGSLTDKLLSERLYRGKLFMAESVEEKAYHFYIRNKYHSFILDFRSALYSINISTTALFNDLRPGKGEDQEQEPEEIDINSIKGWHIFKENVGIQQISNIFPRFLYIERDDITDERLYVFDIQYSNGAPREIIKLEGNHVAAPDAFNKALLKKSYAGKFDGDPRQFKILSDRWFSSNMKRIISIPFVGYDNTTNAYVFQDRAYHKGREIPLNRDGYFQVKNGGIKTSLVGTHIITDGKFDPSWLNDYSYVFHHQGMVLLAFWFGSLFAQQVRAIHKSYPFLEYTGEPGTGKSTALEFLWACSGRDDWEGFDIMKSSKAGRGRAMVQVSNLPVVLIESDRDNGSQDAKAKQYDFDELKSAYNGRTVRTMGVAKRGNEVDESPFRAAVIISQNAEVDGSEALLQRIVHVHADKKHHKPDSRDIARWFEKQTSSTVGGLLRKALQHELQILSTYEKYFAIYEEQFGKSGKIRNERIVKNHAQVAAFGKTLQILFPSWTDERQAKLAEYILKRAEAREQRLAHDHPIIEQFWESYHYLNSQHPTKADDFLNHANGDGLLAINLPQFREMCQKHGQELVDQKMLKKLLPQGKRHKFVECRNVASKHLERNDNLTGKAVARSMRCWVFKK